MQNRNFDGSGFPPTGPQGKDIPLGARILRIVRDLAELGENPHPTDIDFATLEHHKHRYDPDLFAKIRTLLAIVDEDGELPPEGREMVVRIDQLRVNDFLLTNLETTSDRVVLTHGSFVSDVQLERIRVFQKSHDFREPIEIKRGIRRA